MLEGGLKALGDFEKLFQRRPPNLPRRATEEPEFDLTDIQGNILRGYTYPSASYLFLRIDDVTKAKALMKRMLPRVTSGVTWDQPPPVAMQIALTYTGLERVGVPAKILASFPEDFRQGMAARAEVLGDRGDSHPSRWESGLGTGEAHVLVTVWAIDAAHLDAVRAELREVGASAGATTVVNESRAGTLPGGRDHFGFVDGLAQPAVRGTGVKGRPGDGQPDGGGSWRDVATGEFLHGYIDEDETLPEAPAAPFDKNGTFMVYRKIQMDVARFRRTIQEVGKRFPGGPELLAAKIVGRWPDGTPVSLSPDRPDPAIASDPSRINNFGYANDAQGLRCPLGSHIRRVNPREDIPFFGGRLTNRHRIIRRGRPYGPPLPEGVLEDDGQERGLVFVCFNANIWRQFETIQTLWVDDGDPFGLGTDRDFLMGCPANGTGKMIIQGKPPFFVSPQPNLCTVRGGEYLYQPSISGLRWLSDLP